MFSLFAVAPFGRQFFSQWLHCLWWSLMGYFSFYLVVPLVGRQLCNPWLHYLLWSLMGYVFTLCGCAVSGEAILQSTRAIIEAIKQKLYGLEPSLMVLSYNRIQLYCEFLIAKMSIHLKNQMYNEKTKHINVKFRITWNSYLNEPFQWQKLVQWIIEWIW